MRIEELMIDRYGRLQNRRIRLASGVNVVYGPNEAGKSTLLAFVRGMLFGFPRAYKRVEDYPGIEPGWGGTMTLLDDRGGRWLLQRSGSGSSQLRHEDGTIQDEQRLSGMWAGLNGETYRQLFAIRLDELQEVSALQSEEIGAFLFHAGMGPGGHEVLKAERAIVGEMDKIYRRRGKVQDLNRTLKDWEEAGRELRKWELEAGRYVSLGREHDVMGEEIAALESKLTSLAARIAWNQLRRKARPIWQERLTLRHEADAVRVNEELLAEAPGLAAFADRWSEYLGSVREQRETEIECEALQAQLRPLLRQFSERWGAEELLAFAGTVSRREEASEFAERFREVRAKEERLRTEEELVEQDKQLHESAAAEDYAAFKSSMEAVGIAAAGIDDDTRLAELRRDLRELVGLSSARGQLLLRLSEWEEQEADVPKSAKDGAQSFGSMALSALVFAFGVWRLAVQDWYAGAIGLAAAAGLLAMGARGTRRGEADREQRSRAKMEQLQAELAQKEQRMAELWRRWQAGHRGEVAAAGGSRKGALADNADSADAIERLVSEVERYEQARTERRRLLRRAEEKGLQLQTSRRFAAERKRELQAEWVAWLEGQGLSNSLTPEGVHALYPMAERGKDLIERLEHAARRMEAWADDESRLFTEAEDRFGTRNAQEIGMRLYARQEAVKREQERAARSLRLREQITQYDAQLRALSGGGDHAELLTAVKEFGEEQLELERLDLMEEETRLKQRIGELREERGRVAHQLERLRSDEETARLRQKREEWKATVLELAGQWAELALSLELIRRTRAVYERERQPEVLQRASRYFSLLTGGRFRQVLVPFGESQLIAVRDTDEQLGADQLSRGTREQLYLAIRFALVEAYARRESLPIVLDDVFVNFDDERFELARRTVQELAGQHQVIVLTCHERVRDAWAGSAAVTIAL